MATFVTWLKDQEKREGDPVGWFARFWRDLEGKPRLSAVASVTKHLEDRHLFEQVHGLTEAHDATLVEYRAHRAGTVRAVAQDAGVQLPLPEHQPGAEEPPRGLAGQAVDRATAAAQEAAQARGFITADQMQQGVISPAPSVTITGGSPTAADLASLQMLLGAALRKLERIERAMGLATDEDDGALPAELPWSAWYEQAAVFATARGEGWDQPEAG